MTKSCKITESLCCSMKEEFVENSLETKKVLETLMHNIVFSGVNR